MIAGVDEAGRGPVLGPLVVAAVMAKSHTAMRNLGVADSKKLSPAKREELAPLIRKKALAVEVRVVSVDELNERMTHATLNTIEVEAFGELLSRLQPKEACLDACDVDAERFGRLVAQRVGPPPAAELATDSRAAGKAPAEAVLASHTMRVRSEHKGDDRWPLVAAASIIAKTERDRLVAELEAEYGPTGSGYASDPATKRFLESWHAEHGELPACARRHWETSRRLVPAAPRRTLADYP